MDWNLGIKLLGSELVLDRLLGLYRDIKSPVVSVGSGSGCLESAALKKDPSMQLQCVDPDPLSFSKGPVLVKPDFPRVEDLLRSRPDLLDNCVLLLNWAPPDCDFDLEAIRSLRPRAILCVFEVFFKAAGSELFHEWLTSQSEYLLLQKDTLNQPNWVEPVMCVMLKKDQCSPASGEKFATMAKPPRTPTSECSGRDPTASKSGTGRPTA